ncbi:sigma-70 family RNA polymerase sigma factor [Nitrospina gracilis]|uniref:sigma-70 family RNA polymerase sigma factor n=1 Tax=Nitrospina gracilis TaxID=35801 RepID=UPI001F010042|nr:RNA polymerase sigma-70 factor (ECF subfamily) [Nitrospina gracilis Nb-211]
MDSKPNIDSEQWVDKYGDTMYRFTLVRVKDPMIAHDIIQTTLLAALQAQHTFAGKSSEKSWLFGILKHKIMDHFRSQKSQRTYELTPDDDADPYENAYNESGHWVSPPRNWEINPEKAVENTQLMEALNQCMDGLSGKFRDIFVMKEIEGMSSEDICKEMGIKPTNLWVILHRARNQLKKCLETHYWR